MAKTTKEMIEVMEWFENGGEVEYLINPDEFKFSFTLTISL